MACQGCSELDFVMRCEVKGDNEDELDCEGIGGGWESYDFQWRRR